jgi:hypothetical protein
MAEDQDKDRLIGVFGDEKSAEEAARAAQAAGATDVRVGSSENEVASLRSEMREEAADVKPGFSTPQMAWSVPLWAALAALVGVAAATPLAFIDGGDLPLATRLLIVVCVGAVIGGTVGLIFGTLWSGGYLGRRRVPKPDLAAERGVVVGASEGSSQVAPTLADHDPERLDRVAPSGQPKDTVPPEQGHGDSGDQSR